MGLTRGGEGLDARGEPIAASVARFDEARAPGIVGERAAKLLDARRKRRIADDRVTPDALEQLLPSDELAGARHERAQDGGRPRREADLAPTGPQPPRPRVEAMAVEDNRLFHRRSR